MIKYVNKRLKYKSKLFILNKIIASCQSKIVKFQEKKHLKKTYFYLIYKKKILKCNFILMYLINLIT